MPNSHSQPSLVVFDLPNQNLLEDENDELQRFLTRANTHIVIVMDQTDLDSVQKFKVIARQLYRGSTTIEAHLLSPVDARMRIVCAIQNARDLKPTDQHRKFISGCAETDADPNEINVLCAFVESNPLTNVACYTKEQILQDTIARLTPNELKFLSNMGSASTNHFIKSTEYLDQTTSNKLQAMKLLLPVPNPVVYHPTCGGQFAKVDHKAGGDHFYVPSFIYRYI